MKDDISCTVVADGRRKAIGFGLHYYARTVSMNPVFSVERYPTELVMLEGQSDGNANH